MVDLSGKIGLDEDDMQEIGALDEPVTQTLSREFQRVGAKLKCVLLPNLSIEVRSREIRDWDLWGPLFICLFLAMVLSLSTSGSKSEASAVFAIVFMVVWVGAGVVSVNAQLLGGTISFFQSVCVLGYSIFPLALSAVVIATLQAFIPAPLKLGLVAVGVLWSIYSSIGFLTQLVPAPRKLLAEYPLILFFMFLGWFILAV